MPKNQVQFQKGQSLPEFLALYGSVAQCEQAVFQARWPNGFRCPNCGYHKSCQLRQRKVWQCIRCKQQVSLTAGTLFDNTKLPLTTWFLAIYLLSQAKNGISAMYLKRQLGVSYNTAWTVKHKLMQTMRERDDSQPLRGIVEVDDAYLGGETSGGKRGRWGSSQDAFCGRGPGECGRASGAAAAEPGGGLPQACAASLGRAAPASRNAGAFGRAGLFPGCAGGRLRAPSAGDGRRQGQLRGARLELGEHPAGQRQACDRRHLSCLCAALYRALSSRIRLPFQSALPIGRSRASSRLCCGAHSAPVRAAPNFGWNCWVIRYGNTE